MEQIKSEMQAREIAYEVGRIIERSTFQALQRGLDEIGQARVVIFTPLKRDEVPTIEIPGEVSKDELYTAKAIMVGTSSEKHVVVENRQVLSGLILEKADRTGGFLKHFKHNTIKGMLFELAALIYGEDFR